MRADSEHSPASRRASNRLHALLRLAATSCGAERAFLAQTADPGDGTEPRVVAVSTARDDGSRVTSRSVIRRALAGPRPMLLLHVVAPLASAASVRGLGLRSIVSMPVPLPPLTVYPIRSRFTRSASIVMAAPLLTEMLVVK